MSEEWCIVLGNEQRVQASAALEESEVPCGRRLAVDRLASSLSYRRDEIKLQRTILGFELEAKRLDAG